MKSKNSIYQLTIFMFLSFLFTAEIKLGYINADKIFSNLDEVRQVSIEMEKEQRKIEVEYQNLQFELDSLLRNYEQQKMLMSEDRRVKTEQTIQTKGAELERFLQSKTGPQGELYQIQERLMAPIYDKIDKAVNEVGKEEGYDYIFNGSTGLIIYSIDQYDITQKVIDKIKKMAQSENE